MQEEKKFMDIPEDQDCTSLMHYGMPRRSGRYPWGSGDEPYQHGSSDFLTRVEDYRKNGMSDKEIMDQMGMKSCEFRAKESIAKNERKLYLRATARALQDRGYSVAEISQKMNIPWSTAKQYLTSKESTTVTKAQELAKFLEQKVDEKGFIDIGANVERELGQSRERMVQAEQILKDDGYNVYKGRLEQVTNSAGKKTTFVVACGPKATKDDVFGADGAIRTGKVESINEYSSNDGGITYGKSLPPESISSKRVFVRYSEDGGLDRDGTIEIRPGVKDLSLGNSHYAQVRIGVDGTHYLKGMALYSDNIPKGYDIVFNTNKSKGKDMMGFDPDGTPNSSGVLKPMKNSEDNPFGVLLKLNGQSFYKDPNGKYTDADGDKASLSAVNKLREEGDWSDYKRKLPSQFLAKQNLSLVKNQLNEDIADRQAQYKDICSLTNPTIKKHFLNEFAETCDKAAYQLKAAALPRQAYQVIIPTPNMKDNEIYAPNFKNGEKVALVRFPHGGTFEIPILKVNNNDPEAKKILGQAKDAVGINKKNADRLSGADFDGDTVLVIPTGKNKVTDIKSTPQLAGLKNFDPKEAYGTTERIVKGKDGKDIHEYISNETGLPIKVMKDTQKQMGVVSNLITDMHIRGASDSEIARAVRHSMVVIDAEKHKLDYKKSEIDNDIKSLQRDYQGHYDLDGKWKVGGASTLLSRAKGETPVTKRKGEARINKIDAKTGKLAREDLPEGAIYWNEDPYAHYVDKNGKERTRTQKSKQMLEVRDANQLSSGSSVESEYARYANTMKAMANEARKEMIHTGNLKYDKNAKDIYKNEIDSLNKKVEIAALNAPRERRAQVIATGKVRALTDANPELLTQKDKLKKLRQQALNDARVAVGAGSKYIDENGNIKTKKIEITDREWDAIQAGAISESKLKVILNKADKDNLMQRSLPRRNNRQLAESTIERIKHYKEAGCTPAQIAEQLNMSTDTIKKYM